MSALRCTSAQSLRSLYKVVIDVSALRRKGVLLEDIIDAVPGRYGVYLAASPWGGIPTALIGSVGWAEWRALRATLRDKGLLRTPVAKEVA